jgi:isoleucyl-tRNA synthetase
MENPSHLELEVLKFWEDNSVFEKSVSQRRYEDPERYAPLSMKFKFADGDLKSDPFVIYEGPPTANGKPGLHHVLTRTYKDIIGRFWTMQGKLIERRAGWDEHGLPVEIEVQKELGLHTKAKIEEYGVKAFNDKCAESTQRYINEWEELTRRMGYWLDLKHPYRTSDPEYIKHVWAILGQLYHDGLIYRASKVVPWACDSGTVMSNHEVALGYKEVIHRAAWVKFKLCDDMNSIVAWTTTPWTLPSNMALAVNPDLDYKFCRHDGQEGGMYSLWQHGPVVKTVKGRDLVGQEYYHPWTGEHCIVVAADFVTADRGGMPHSGVVHIAPAFGQDDYEVWQKQLSHMPIKCHVDPDGTFNDQAPECLRGTNVLHSNFETANRAMEKELAKKGLLVSEWGQFLKYDKEEETFHSVTHQYPHNWRTGKPLIYYLRPCWYVAVNKYRDKLIAANEKVEWFPGWVKNGRFGEWLKGNVDWAISRERFWGTPLPFFTVGSPNQSAEGPLQDERRFEVMLPSAAHRPEADARLDVIFTPPLESELPAVEWVRTPEVLDCWFDSGAMPFAAFDEYKQADVICEAIDQTRGWFYSLLAIGVALKGEAPYKNVVCLGHLVDKHGQKMSKTKGNAVDPWEMFNKYGADAVRWYMAKVPTGNQITFNEDDLKTVRQVFMNRLWNTYQFLEQYRRIMMPWFDPGKYTHSPPPSAMDQWILSLCNRLLKDCESHYKLYQFSRVVEDVEWFLDQVSNVWVRANRARFSVPHKVGEHYYEDEWAFYTLRECLLSICFVIAPIMPFMSEYIYQRIEGLGRCIDFEGEIHSVHLKDWPKYLYNPLYHWRKDWASPIPESELFQQMQEAQDIIAVGHKLRNSAGIKVRQPLQAIHVPERLRMKHFEEFVREELNVKAVLYFMASTGSPQDVITLNTTLTPQLLAEGSARDFVRAVQVVRKDMGLQIADRIDLVVDWRGNDKLRDEVNLCQQDVTDKLHAIYWREGEGNQEIKVSNSTIAVRVAKCS